MGEGLAPSLARLVADAGRQAKPRPVERWNPPYCGEIDIRIAADGRWFHAGTPIAREPLVRLFASILRFDPGQGHVLVTPVEKLGITVEDAPFVAVDVVAEGSLERQSLTFRTNVGDIVAAGTDHLLRFEREEGTDGLKPYLSVRPRLEALATRRVALDIAALATEHAGRLGVWSGGTFFPFPQAQGEVAHG